MDASDADEGELNKFYDLYLLGCSWGEEEIETRVGKLGASLISQSLKIDGEPEEDEITEWAQDVINAA